MFNQWTRRSFLGAVPGILARPQPAASLGAESAGKTLDIHLHLFGTGDAGSGCRVSKRVRNGWLFRALESGLQVQKRAATVDEGYVKALTEHLRTSDIDKGVILSQDAVYGPDGKPDWKRTHVYVPNDYLLRITARFADRMIPCVSINPERGDALNELDRCAEAGARVLKIHPPIQGVDVSNKKYKPFFRACAKWNFLVMVHTGHEHAAPIVDANLANPRRLSLALEEGCTVVACHCGTGRPADRPDMLPDFLAMLRRYDNLWGDTAVLGSRGRERDVGRLLEDQIARERLLHGSDFPFPPDPMAFANRLGVARSARMYANPSLVQQDFELKQALGFDKASAERAWELVSARSRPRPVD